VYHENNERAMREHSRIQDRDSIMALIEAESRTFPVFKPLNDAQYALDQLNLHPRARGIWMYRDYSDVANSCVTKWGDAFTPSYARVATGQTDGASAEAVDAAMQLEGMSDDTLGQVRSLVGTGLTAHEAAALHWYCRNRLYFDLGLHRDPRVELVRYEDLVREPDVYLRRVFDFVGCEYRPEFAESVFGSSIRKQEAAPMSASVTALCDTMTRALDSEYLRRIGHDSTPKETE
jgi:hypothetical protein